MISYKKTDRQYYEWTEKDTMSGQTSTMNGQKNGQTRSTNRQRSSASG